MEFQLFNNNMYEEAIASFQDCYQQALSDARKYRRLAAQRTAEGDLTLAWQLNQTADFHEQSANEAAAYLRELNAKSEEIQQKLGKCSIDYNDSYYVPNTHISKQNNLEIRLKQVERDLENTQKQILARKNSIELMRSHDRVLKQLREIIDDYQKANNKSHSVNRLWDVELEELRSLL